MIRLLFQSTALSALVLLISCAAPQPAQPSQSRTAAPAYESESEVESQRQQPTDDPFPIDESREPERIVLVIDGEAGASFNGVIKADDEQLEIQGTLPVQYEIEGRLIICELEGLFDTRRVQFKVIRDGRVRYLEGTSIDGTARFVYRGNWEMEFYGKK